MNKFKECFSSIEDPRTPNVSHNLIDILFISLRECQEISPASCNSFSVYINQ